MADEARGVRVVRGDDVAPAKVEKARHTRMVTLVGPREGAPHFSVRRFVISSGGRIPAHSHDRIEHQQVVVAGEMVVTMDGEAFHVQAGDALFIPPGTVHAYENRGPVDVEFICVVPLTEKYETAWHEETEEP